MEITNKMESKLMQKAVTGIVGVVTALTLSACAGPQDAVDAARSAGWRQAEVVDTSYFFNFKCAEGEIAYKIQGLNPRDEKASATVCCGYTTPFKGCTIRY